MREDLAFAKERDGAEVAATVAAAVDAGLFRALAGEPATAAVLAERLALDQRATRIVLEALRDFRLLVRDGDVYRLTEPARRGLGDPDSSDYVGGGFPLWLANLRDWTRLGEALETGAPVSAAAEDRDADRRSLARFLAGMAAAPAKRLRHIVEACLARRPESRTLLDVGGGPGHIARAFLDAGLETATLFERPPVVEFVADAYGLDDVDGLELVAGDFMAEPLPPGPFDIALLSNITHMYSAEENRALLAKVRDVVVPGGVVAIGDFVRGRSSRAPRFAIMMLLNTDGGDTYTEAEYRGWLEENAFVDVVLQDVDTDRQLLTAIRGDAPP